MPTPPQPNPRGYRPHSSEPIPLQPINASVGAARDAQSWGYHSFSHAMDGTIDSAIDPSGRRVPFVNGQAPERAALDRQQQGGTTTTASASAVKPRAAAAGRSAASVALARASGSAETPAQDRSQPVGAPADQPADNQTIFGNASSDADWNARFHKAPPSIPNPLPQVIAGTAADSASAVRQAAQMGSASPASGLPAGFVPHTVPAGPPPAVAGYARGSAYDTNRATADYYAGKIDAGQLKQVQDADAATRNKQAVPFQSATDAANAAAARQHPGPPVYGKTGQAVAPSDQQPSIALKPGETRSFNGQPIADNARVQGINPIYGGGVAISQPMDSNAPSYIGTHGADAGSVPKTAIPVQAGALDLADSVGVPRPAAVTPGARAATAQVAPSTPTPPAFEPFTFSNGNLPQIETAASPQPLPADTAARLTPTAPRFALNTGAPAAMVSPSARGPLEPKPLPGGPTLSTDASKIVAGSLPSTKATDYATPGQGLVAQAGSLLTDALTGLGGSGGATGFPRTAATTTAAPAPPTEPPTPPVFSSDAWQKTMAGLNSFNAAPDGSSSFPKPPGSPQPTAASVALNRPTDASAALAAAPSAANRFANGTTSAATALAAAPSPTAGWSSNLPEGFKPHPNPPGTGIVGGDDGKSGASAPESGWSGTITNSTRDPSATNYPTAPTTPSYTIGRPGQNTDPDGGLHTGTLTTGNLNPTAPTAPQQPKAPTYDGSGSDKNPFSGPSSLSLQSRAPTIPSQPAKPQQPQETDEQKRLRMAAN